MSLLALLVFFFVVRSRLSVIVGVQDVLCELDAKLAFLDPGCLWLQLHRRLLELELLQHKGLVHARDHVRRLDERETERRLQVNLGTSAGLVTRERRRETINARIYVLEEAAQSLLLREHSQVHIFTIVKELSRVGSIVLVGASEILSCLLCVAQLTIEHASKQPKLIGILLSYGLHDVV